MSYLLRLGLFTAAVLTAVAGANSLVDPFAIYGMPIRAGFNADKVALADYARFARPLQILRRQPRVVLLGTSRIRDGIDPLDLGGDGVGALNYGVPALSVIEAEAFAEHAIRVAPVRELIIGLDFFQFNDDVPYKAGFDRNLLGDGIGPYAFFRSTLSYVAVRQSWLTVADSRADPGSVSFRSDGFRARDERSLAETVDGILIDVEDFAGRYRRMASIDVSLHALERMLAAATQRGVDVRVFFSPMHAALHEAVHRRDSWPLFERWKREVLAIAERTNTPVWDFSGYNEVTTVPFDDAGTFYFDGSHYRPAVGRRILAIIGQSAGVDRGDGRDGGEERPRVRPGGFGVRLTPDTLEAHLSATRANRAAYVESMPQDIAPYRGKLGWVALGHGRRDGAVAGTRLETVARPVVS